MRQTISDSPCAAEREFGQQPPAPSAGAALITRPVAGSLTEVRFVSRRWEWRHLPLLSSNLMPRYVRVSVNCLNCLLVEWMRAFLLLFGSVSLLTLQTVALVFEGTTIEKTAELGPSVFKCRMGEKRNRRHTGELIIIKVAPVSNEPCVNNRIRCGREILLLHAYHRLFDFVT